MESHSEEVRQAIEEIYQALENSPSLFSSESAEEQRTRFFESLCQLAERQGVPKPEWISENTVKVYTAPLLLPIETVITLNKS